MTFRTIMIMNLVYTAALCASTIVTTSAHAAVDRFGTTIVASTGTVDEKGLNKVEFKSGRAKIKDNVNNARVTIRYDVQLTHDDRQRNCEVLWLYLRFKDNGPKARIIAKLKGYDMFAGTTETLITFDSDDFDADDSYQREFALRGPWVLDPSTAYFLEVTLIKQAARGTPELGAMEVWVTDV